MTPKDRELLVKAADALERLRRNAELCLARKPVRDWAETFAEVDDALKCLNQANADEAAKGEK